MPIGIRRPDQPYGGPPGYIEPPQQHAPRPQYQPPSYQQAAPAPPPNFYGPVNPQGWPIVSQDPIQQDRYEQMRREGQSHNMAEMLASRAFPGVVTDATFMTGRHNHAGLSDVHPESRQHYLDQAQQAGVHVGGRAYMASLARFPGDPQAWVDSRADVERVARMNNMTVQSPTINVQAPRYYDPGPEVRVAPDIINNVVGHMAAQDPYIRQNAPDYAQDVADRLGGYHAIPSVPELYRELHQEGVNPRWFEGMLSNPIDIHLGARKGEGVIVAPDGMDSLPMNQEDLH